MQRRNERRGATLRRSRHALLAKLHDRIVATYHETGEEEQSAHDGKEHVD